MTLVPSSARLSSKQRDETPLFGRLAGRFHRFVEMRRTRRLLRDLDDHLLRDIGLTRRDVASLHSDAWQQLTRP